jgi:hypothetical protein
VTRWLLHDEVHQFVRAGDHFDHLLAGEELVETALYLYAGAGLAASLPATRTVI